MTCSKHRHGGSQLPQRSRGARLRGKARARTGMHSASAPPLTAYILASEPSANPCTQQLLAAAHRGQLDRRHVGLFARLGAAKVELNPQPFVASPTPPLNLSKTAWQAGERCMQPISCPCHGRASKLAQHWARECPQWLYWSSSSASYASSEWHYEVNHALSAVQLHACAALQLMALPLVAAVYSMRHAGDKRSHAD